MRKLYAAVILLFFLLPKLNGQSPVSVTVKELPDGFQFVDKKSGTKVNDLIWEETESFVNGFARVFTDHKWGFVNGKGELAIPVIYESARNFVDHLAAVRRDGKWGFINEKGDIVIPFQYDIVFDFKEKVAGAYKQNKWVIVNKLGATIKNLDVDVFYGFKNGKAKISRNGQIGWMNTQGDIISMEPKKTNDATSSYNAARISSNESGSCPANIDFENGDFTNWTCYVGTVAAQNNTNVVTVTPSAPTPNRHEIVTSSNPSNLDPYGLFSINPPDGSGYAVKLGNDVNGAKAERISYQIDVPANSVDASITYRYAVVFQDPGHQTWEQPRFSAKLLDVATNTYLPCATYEYISTSSLPGFQSSPLNDTVKFKTWASVYVNLSHYAGKSLILEFTTADCTKGAHWGYAYVDVGDCNIAASVEYHCNPNEAIFTAPPGFEFYNWWNSDFSTLLGSGETMTLVSPPAPGAAVHVEVIPFNGYGCSDTLEVSVPISNPTAEAGPNKSMCKGSSTTIGSSAVSGNTYAWSPADYLSNPNVAMPVSVAPATTKYMLTVTNNVTGCFSQDSVIVSINPKPLAAFDPVTPQCLSGNSFSFTNTSSISAGTLSYYWNFGDGNSATQTNPAHSFATAGTYSVKLVATSNNGCKDSTTHPAITVYANPVVKTNNDLAICRGNTAQLQTTGAQTYTWTASPDLSCTDCANPVASPLTNSTFYVKGLDGYGCPGYDTVNITVYQPINVSVSPGRAICNGESIGLQAGGNAATYTWSPAQTLSSSNTTTTVATPTATTQYRVIGFDGHDCFTDTGFVTITVNPKPAIQLGPDVTLNTGTLYPLTSTTQNGPIVSWQWSPATDLSCTTCPDPSATIKNDITYYVNITNMYGCVANDSINIRTICEGSQVFIPNAFTPDGDGVNDVFIVRAKGIESVRSFRVFSRWGELIFEKKDFPPNVPSYGWDGKIKGVTAPAEVYVYTAEVTCDNMQTYVYKGNVSLLK